MANMDKIYALQEVIRKKTNAFEKDGDGYRQNFFIERRDKLKKEDAARGVRVVITGMKVKMKFSTVDLATDEEKCEMFGVLGFGSVTLNAVDSHMMRILFEVGGRTTPAEFKKICEGQNPMYPGVKERMGQTSSGFDSIIGEICQKNGIVLDKTKQFGQAAQALANDAKTNDGTKQFPVQGREGNSL
ncbi:MAG: hypothetical protein IKZ34_02045 [Alphaproteobacteria bacterium]|nr:hypothetical protein [Alphaproteobacteria bacterium]